MQIIAANILTLDQCNQGYNCATPDRCSSCKMANALHRHGNYPRKSDRHAKPSESLNPVKIFRFICKFCRKTCSVLPECIAPKRWYTWIVQQLVISSRLAGNTWDAISLSCHVSAKTCRRWFNRLQDYFYPQREVLRNTAGELGSRLLHCCQEFTPFWKECLSHINLSRAMLICYESRVAVT